MQDQARFGRWRIALVAVGMLVIFLAVGAALAQQSTPQVSTPVGALEGAPADGGLFRAENDNATTDNNLFGAIDEDALAAAEMTATVAPPESETILSGTPVVTLPARDQQVTPLPLSGANSVAFPPVLPIEIAVGDVVTGSLDEAQLARSYLFVAPSNGLLVIQLDTDFLMQVTFTSAYESPDGSGGGSGGGGGLPIEDDLRILPARAGEQFRYTFVAPAGETGEYSLSVSMLNTADMLPLAYGESVTGTLSQAQPFAVYMFNGAAGDMAAVSAVTDMGAAVLVQVLPVSSDSEDTPPQFPVILPVPPEAVMANFDSRLVLRNDGVYGIVVQGLSSFDEMSQAFSLSFSQITGGLDELPQYVRLLPDDRVRVLTFMGTAGEAVTLSARLLGFEAGVAIEARQGEAVLATFNTADSVFPTQEMTQQFTIPADGTVEVMVMGETFPQVSPESLSVIEVQLILTR